MMASLSFSLDTPLLVRSSSDSAISPQQMESEASHAEDSAGMVRPSWTNVPPQILASETYNKENICYHRLTTVNVHDFAFWLM